MIFSFIPSFFSFFRKTSLHLWKFSLGNAFFRIEETIKSKYYESISTISK